MFRDCLGAWDFKKTSKNNGIIIALTTRGKEEEGDTQGDRERETEREGEWEGEREVMSVQNRQ